MSNMSAGIEITRFEIWGDGVLSALPTYEPLPVWVGVCISVLVQWVLNQDNSQVGKVGLLFVDVEDKSFNIEAMFHNFVLHLN